MDGMDGIHRYGGFAFHILSPRRCFDSFIFSILQKYYGNWGGAEYELGRHITYDVVIYMHSYTLLLV